MNKNYDLIVWFLYNRIPPDELTSKMPSKAEALGHSLKNTTPINKAKIIAVYLKGEINEISPERITNTAV